MDQSSASVETKSNLPELRLLDRRAFVGFPPISIGPGLTITDFALQIPDVKFPFNVTAGALHYQRRRLDFGLLELSIDAEFISRQVNAATAKLADLEDLALRVGPGYLEGRARIPLGEHAPLTFKVALDSDGERLAFYFYDIRFYGFAAAPAAQIPILLTRWVQDLSLLPEVERRGATGFVARVLPMLARFAAVSRGYRMPSLEQARLNSIEVSPNGIRLRFASGGVPPPAAADPAFLMTMEGARAFADAEELIAQGRLKDAREFYLTRGDAEDAHPFAAERLLGLLVADPKVHDLALDLASALGGRREKSPTALWAEAVVRERLGEPARAAERYLALSAISRKEGEVLAALSAAEAAARVARDQAPHLAARALHEILGLKPDHLPSLQSLAQACEVAGDRAGAIRAYRRIAALARDPLDSAQAHVRLAQLCAQSDDEVAAARLHCEAALRIAPDHPPALQQLAELCLRGGEHLRAIKAADRLHQVSKATHELAQVAYASLLAGQAWELGLQQYENALLRYREVASLRPADSEPAYLRARVAERLGRWQEALASYQQAVELAGPAPLSEEIRKVAHQAHHALSRLAKSRLSDSARAREHLRAALALEPKDPVALNELLPYLRVAGSAKELADACENAAALADNALHRSSLLAEAGELHRTRLGQPDDAERLLKSALESDPKNRTALEGMLALAEGQRDAQRVCQWLRLLAEQSADPHHRLRYYQRLVAAARDLAQDPNLAALALSEVLALAPEDLASWAELCALQRRRGDSDGLAFALSQRAQVAERQGDFKLAAAVLRELAQALDRQLGRSAEAFLALESSSKLNPEPQVLLELADLGLRCDRVEHARQVLEALIERAPPQLLSDRLGDAYAKLALACERTGDLESAERSYARAFQLRPEDDLVSEQLAQLYLKSARFAKLAEVYSSRAKAFTGTARAEECPALLLKAAEALRQSDHPDEALAPLTAALEIDPKGPLAQKVLERLVELHLALGRSFEAARALGKQADLVGNTPLAAQLLMRAASLAENAPEEIDYVSEAVRRAPDLIPARCRRAQLLGEANPLQALEDLEVVLNAPLADPHSPKEEQRMEWVYQAAIAATRAGAAEAAERYLALYAEQHPGDLKIQHQLAAAHRQMGSKHQLFEVLSQLWPQLDGEERLRSCREFAALALELGRSEPALQALRYLRGQNLSDRWVAKGLLSLIPDQGGPGEDEERCDLLATLAEGAPQTERADWLLQRARIHRRRGRLEAAASDLSEVATLSAQPGLVFRELAQLARERGNGPAELAAWKEVIARGEASPEVAAQMVKLAQAFVGQEEKELAHQTFSLAATLPLDPADRCEAFTGLAQTWLARGDRSAALEALLEASAQGPVAGRAAALVGRGALLEEQEQWQLAGQSYESALLLLPRHPAALEGLERALRQTEDWAGLVEVLAVEAAQASKQSAATLYQKMGEIYLHRLGHTGPAEAALLKAARLSPSNVAVRKELLHLLAERGELAQAAELLEEAAEVAPVAEASEILWEGSQVARRMDDLSIALKLARKAHQLKPAQDQRLIELADLLYLQGASKEALPLYQRAADELNAEDFPDVARDVALRLADLAEQAGEDPLAERTLRGLTDQQPMCAAAVERLSVLLGKTRPREAIEVLWNHARQLGPSQQRTDQLTALAMRAQTELMDAELAARFLSHAAEGAVDPLPVHRAAAELYRQSGRMAELSGELKVLFGLYLAGGSVEEALDAGEEALRLLEQIGREEDAALELQKMEAALLDSFRLRKQLSTARAGAALARRRRNFECEADWLEQSLEWVSAPRERAQVLVRLAELFTDALHLPSRAEEVLRQALQQMPELKEAEDRLVALLEEQGRYAELARYFELSAEQSGSEERRVRLLRRASDLYRVRLGRLESAAAALIAAGSTEPSDLEVMAQAAELLDQAGKETEVAQLDAALLEVNPLRAPSFGRHAEYLRRQGDQRSLAMLLAKRARMSQGPLAAQCYLDAAVSYRAIGMVSEAAECERQAFAAAPEHDAAFLAVKALAGPDPRRMAELLLRRADAHPEERVGLLRERSALLSSLGEPLSVASALDDLLKVAPEDAEALYERAELAAQAEGPVAAQPFDRRLLNAAGEEFAPEVLAKVHLRLGQASFTTGAFKDAADSLEQALRLDADSERGRAALSLLAEVYAKLEDVRGLYRVTLKLAQSSPLPLGEGQGEGAGQPSPRREKGLTEEAEALYRRAANLLEDPAEAIDALLPLARARPSDADAVDRAARGLEALERYPALVELYEQSADACGGNRAAKQLFAAAELCDERLGQPDRAAALRERAGRAFFQLGEFAKAASAWLVACERLSGEARQQLLGDALEAWTKAEDRAAAQALTSKLAAYLVREGMFQELLNVALACERDQRAEKAVELYQQLALGEKSSEWRAAAIDRLLKLESELNEGIPLSLGDLLLERARQLGGEVHQRVLEHLSHAMPSRRKELLQERLELERRRERPERLESILEMLVQLEQDGATSAALCAELGELLIKRGETERARDLFERALDADPRSLPAARRLFELAPTSHHADCFVSLAEQRLHREGADALDAYREALGDAYSLLGRKADAYLSLSGLPENPSRLRKRIGLAKDLGLYGEALQLQERLSDDPEDLERVLTGYLQAQLLPFAIRLGERLLQSGTVSQQTRRWMAQRFAPTRDGAELAVRLWPDLLKTNLGDADGWTLFAEALRHLGRIADAELSDGFGAALSASTGVAPMATLTDMDRPLAGGPWGTIAFELVPISADSMPRLHSALRQQLDWLGAANVELFLSTEGGVEAFLADHHRLVLGARSLACLGTAELTYLMALALALGEEGWRLRTAEPIEGMERAAVAAFNAVPASLAACRVLVHLDPTVRGAEPSAIRAGEVLKKSPLFSALATRALARLAP